MVLVQANGKVNQQGAIADYLEVEAGYERAVEACLGELLQHIVVERAEHAAAGFQLVREAGAGRCGFLVTEAAAAPARSGFFSARMSVTGDASLAAADGSLGTVAGDRLPDGVVALSSVVRVNGPFAAAIRQAIGDAGIAQSHDGAAVASRLTPLATVTLGDVFRGRTSCPAADAPSRAAFWRQARDQRALRDRIAADRRALAQLAQGDGGVRGATIAHASNAIAALNAEHHKQEKAVVGHDAQPQLPPRRRR
jgi:chromosome segregation protein